MISYLVRLAIAGVFAIAAAPALAAPNCKALEAEAQRLEKEMGEIGRKVAASANSRAAQGRQMAIGSMVAQGVGQFVPMGGLLSQGLSMARQAQAHGAAAAMEDQMARMRTASARLTEVEMLRARHCGE